MSDNDTVDAFLGRICRAWNAGDAAAYAEQFASDATYVIFLGDVMFGRDAIRDNHHDVFTKWQRGTRMRVAAVDVRPVDTATIVVTTIGGVGTGDTTDYDKFQTYVLRNRDNHLECVAFQNTEMSEHAKRKYNS